MELGNADLGDVVLEKMGGGKHCSGRDKLAKLRSRRRKESETISPQKLLTTWYWSSEDVESTRALDNAVTISARTAAISVS